MNFRSPATHTMSPWVRNTFLTVLPKLLLMRSFTTVQGIRNFTEIGQLQANTTVPI